MTAELTSRGCDGPLEDLVGRRMMLAFDGLVAPPEVLEHLAVRAAAGFSLFRYRNVGSPEQVRALTATLQAARRAGPPLLIAADQEGGQVLGLGGGTTPFTGNMALGAVGDPELARRVGAAIGTECRALGVNVDYAPVCDLATNATNPALGTRSFGDDPAAVAALAAAFVTGLQGAGVAATVKHFPGIGDAAVDSHHELPTIELDRRAFDAHELVPFRAALGAGARLVMTGHVAVPALTGSPDLPATLSSRVVRDLLRDDLGFDGIVISDAFDMRAIAQGEGQVVDALAAVRAGVDLLLLAPGDDVRCRLDAALRAAVRRELVDADDLRRSVALVDDLRRWVAGFPQPDLDVVGCGSHRDLAAELARRSLTLVRDDAGLLPLRLPADGRVLVVTPTTVDLTPADTSATVDVDLAGAVAALRPGVRSVRVPHAPGSHDVAAVLDAARDADAVVVATIGALAEPGQAALVSALQESTTPLVVVALRTPYDLLAFPAVSTYVCTYGVQPPVIAALAAALFGEAPFAGSLPVGLGRLFPRGHGVRHG
jgi:beta-N-acetylhexosaminidase